jgi:type IX secretion system PorP/SprF family membrane protein
MENQAGLYSGQSPLSGKESMSSRKIYTYIVSATVIVLLSCITVNAQQSQPFTQYLFNRFLLNPAAAGSDGFSSVGVVIKDQWTGFSASPTNQTLTGQARLPRQGLFGSRSRRGTSGFFSPENIGVGVALFNDIRGPIRTTGAQFTYAYHLEDRFGQLSLGLSANLFQLYIDRGKIETEDDDMFLNASKLNSFVPDASFGIHYTTRDYYVGLSVSNLFQSFLMFGGRNSSNYRIERQYLLMGGYIFELNPEWNIMPTLQGKMNEHGIGQLDINVMGYYYDQFWGGFSYRTGGGGNIGGVSLLFGARYKQYHFGYAFDHTLSSIRKYSYGSHELMVTITFGQSERFFRYNRRYEFQKMKGQSTGRRP